MRLGVITNLWHSLIAAIKQRRLPPRSAGRAPVTAKKRNPLTQQRIDTRLTAKETGGLTTLAELVKLCDLKFSRLIDTNFPRHRGQVDTAQLMKHLGCFVPSMETLDADSTVVGMVQSKARPAYLFVSLPDYNVNDRITLQDELSVLCDWVWLFKMDRQGIDWSLLQRCPKDWVIYEMGVGLPKWKKYPSSFVPAAYFAIRPDNTVVELRYKTTKKVSYNRHGDSYAAHQWSTTSQKMVHGKYNWRNMFCVCMDAGLLRELHWAVNVEDKLGNKLSFSLPDNDAPRFFAKRDRDGSKIFHAVIAHTRKNGSTVKTHYRGSRSFTMGDYKINIQIPGKHNALLYELPDAMAAGDIEVESRLVRDFAPVVGYGTSA